MLKRLLPLFFNIYNNKRLLLVFIFFVSILVSSIYLLVFKDVGPAQHRIPDTDYLTTYKPIAEDILNGNIFEGIDTSGRITEVPPGYPLILSIIFWISNLSGINEFDLIVLFNIIVSALSACLVFKIGNHIFGRKIGLISALLWMSYPFNLWFIKNPNTEVPFIFLLYLGIYLYLIVLDRISFKNIFITGIIIGFASLVRPISILLFFPFILLVFLIKTIPQKYKYFIAVILIVGNILAILPWEVYAFFKIKEIIPLSTLGTIAINEGLTFALQSGEGGNEVVVPSDVRELMEKINARPFNTGGEIVGFYVRELINNPTPLFKLLGIKMARAWYATSQKWYEGRILIIQFFYLLTAFLGITYMLKVYRNKTRYAIFLLSIISYFWLITIATLSVLRYMVPAMGLVIIFSAIFINLLMQKLKIVRKLPVRQE